jgi:two-component system nitrate/nitrite response regulator NarL
MNAREQSSSFGATTLEDTRRQFVNPDSGMPPDSGLSAAFSNPKTNKTVVICDRQPVAAEGLRLRLETSRDLRYQQTLDSLAWALEVVRSRPPDLLVVDKTFGNRAILEWLRELGLTEARISVVIWGASFTEAEALHFMQAGARGILLKTAGADEALRWLLDVAEGRSRMEDLPFRGSAPLNRSGDRGLTAREQQVLERVGKGHRNKEIAQDLGITVGTVKIHLNHIFTKTGMRGRYGLALDGLKS